MHLRNFYEMIQAQNSSIDIAVATIVKIDGHVPQNLGAKLAISEQGSIVAGTIGGGRLEAAVMTHIGNRFIESKHNNTKFAQVSTIEPELLTFDLQKDLGMVCGGYAQIFIEYLIKERMEICIFGAGHVAQALVRTLITLDSKVIVVDPRAEWIEKLPKSPKLSTFTLQDPCTYVDNLKNHMYIILMTQGHATDYPIALKILQKLDPYYFGVIGSVPKSRTLKAKLSADHIHEDKINRIFCPIGLNIGSNTPEEIAISITAQILQNRDNQENSRNQTHPRSTAGSTVV